MVSPWALTWGDENYYLIAYDEKAGKIKHFRVDKLKNIRVLKENRTGKEQFKAFDLAKYSRMSFGMFGGDPVNVKIAFHNDLVGVFLDRFGRNLILQPSKTKDWSETHVEVTMSDQFLGWVFALGNKVKILGPSDVVERYRKELSELCDLYE